jgi:hypothetical protein
MHHAPSEEANRFLSFFGLMSAVGIRSMLQLKSEPAYNPMHADCKEATIPRELTFTAGFGKGTTQCPRITRSAMPVCASSKWDPHESVGFAIRNPKYSSPGSGQPHPVAPREH